MEIVLKGIVSGLVLALLIGPVFFSIIQTSIERGFVSGVLVAIGVSVSDAFYIFLAYMGLSQIFSNGDNQRYMAYLGGVILFAFGAYYLFVKSRRVLDFKSVNIKSTSPLRLITKGFIINGLSPMVLIFWLGTVSVATGEFGYTTTVQVITFFGAIVTTVFITDIIKAKLADKLRTVMTPRLVRIMNLVLGVVMLIFGGRLLLYADNLIMH
ncbi:MAG: LysE family transporter [Cyclobacteriaceae bacterium]|nr:LysE family transporter [Cyclobacteriaceae bacterium]